MRKLLHRSCWTELTCQGIPVAVRMTVRQMLRGVLCLGLYLAVFKTLSSTERFRQALAAFNRRFLSSPDRCRAVIQDKRSSTLEPLTYSRHMFSFSFGRAAGRLNRGSGAWFLVDTRENGFLLPRPLTAVHRMQEEEGRIHKDNLRHLPRFLDFFVSRRILSSLDGWWKQKSSHYRGWD